MHRFRHHRRISTAVVLLAGGALAVQAGSRVPLGADSPQALVERMIKAADDENIAEMLACVDPASRAEATVGLLMGTAMMVAFMDVGSGMAGEMAEGMAEAFAGEEGLKPEDKAKMEQGKAEAAAKAAELKAAYSALLKKHGLPDLADPAAPSPEGSPEEMLANVDQPALAADLFAFMDRLGDKKESDRQDVGPRVPRNAGNFKIEGDRATAQAGGETLEFVKLDGRWFFKPPAEKAAP